MRLTIIPFLILTYLQPAFACRTAIPTLPMEEVVQEAQTIFMGKTLSVKKVETFNYEIEFEALYFWKGEIRKKILLHGVMHTCAVVRLVPNVGDFAIVTARAGEKDLADIRQMYYLFGFDPSKNEKWWDQGELGKLHNLLGSAMESFSDTNPPFLCRSPVSKSGFDKPRVPMVFSSKKERECQNDTDCAVIMGACNFCALAVNKSSLAELEERVRKQNIATSCSFGQDFRGELTGKCSNEACILLQTP